MGTIIKLLILAALLHALFRAGQATVAFYTLRDETEQIARHEGGRSDADLQQRVVSEARENGIALLPEQVTIERDGPKTIIEVRYEQQIELLPRWFYPWRFHFVVDAAAARPSTARDILPQES